MGSGRYISSVLNELHVAYVVFSLSFIVLVNRHGCARPLSLCYPWLLRGLMLKTSVEV